MQVGKKKASALKAVDFVIGRGKKFECRENVINVLLGCSRNFMNDYSDLVRTKTLEDSKGWLAPILYYATPWWIEKGAKINKNDLNIIVGTGLGSSATLSCFTIMI